MSRADMRDRQMMQDQSYLLAMLVEAAKAGQPCPSNAAICGALGFSSSASPSRLLNRLADRGLITIERGVRARVVEITGTGLRTAGEAGTIHPLHKRPAITRPDE